MGLASRPGRASRPSRNHLPGRGGPPTAVVRRALRTRNTTAFRAARDAGLPGNAIRHLLEGRDSRISRLAEICDALGLDLQWRAASTSGDPAPYMATPAARRPSGSRRPSTGPGTESRTGPAADRSGGAARPARQERRRSPHPGDIDRDWFERAIEPLREEYRVMDSGGRASMLVRLVSAFLEVGTSPYRGEGR